MILVLNIPNAGPSRSIGRKESTSNKTFITKLDVNSIEQHAFGEIILKETEKENLSAENETHENIDNEVDEDELYEMDKLSRNENKICNREFESELKTYMI